MKAAEILKSDKTTANEPRSRGRGSFFSPARLKWMKRLRRLRIGMNESNQNGLTLDDVVAALKSGPAVKVSQLLNPPDCTIFALYEGGQILHVGKSRDTGTFVRRACMNCDGFLPLKLARRFAGEKRITYNGGPKSVKALMAKPSFAAVYREQQARLGNAEVRMVEVEDDELRDSLHASAQYILMCPYNDPH